MIFTNGGSFWNAFIDSAHESLRSGNVTDAYVVTTYPIVFQFVHYLVFAVLGGGSRTAFAHCTLPE